MRGRWERMLERWMSVGLIDAATAARIRAFETAQERGVGLRWPMLLAIAFGGLLVGAGVLLFVAAHWETLSPGARFALVLLLVGGFHLAGAATADRFRALSITSHAVGTIGLGAGIFLAGQIFHLQEHWPGGVMLWAAGAWLAFGLLRDWPQAAFAALLTPIWLGGEWIEATRPRLWGGDVLAQGALLAAITYLSAPMPDKDTAVRRALAWIGGLVLIPGVLIVTETSSELARSLSSRPEWGALGWAAAFGLPLAVAWGLRRTAAWTNVVSAGWVLVLGTLHPVFLGSGFRASAWNEIATYAWWALGAIGLVGWGVWEARKERINLGVAGFSLTVLAFYFSEVMDKLGRSASLVGLGVLFLFGGWLLEKTRRRLVARVGSPAA